MTLDQLPQNTPAQITGFTDDQQNAYPCQYWVSPPARQLPT
ncbi:hypothetical protein [Aliamphritea spongicola]|nr:hypothetical protein [Aliamphritea spongicola]